MLDVPILLIVYRRPDLTSQVFERIAAARPRQLFVAADGPRHPGEADVCDAARRAATAVTWPCEVVTDFPSTNLGCRTRVSSALDWFFTSCESGIVLEDDCLPAPEFFEFCRILLDRYRDDRRVVHISGESYRRARHEEFSYYFSKYALIWGWAAWRRTWQSYDLAMRTWPAFRSESAGLAIYDTEDERAYWDGTFQQMYEGRLPTAWSYAWMYACLTQGLSIHPAVNLVRNIGTSDRATHMTTNPFASRSFGGLQTGLRHPAWVVRDRQADMDTFEDRYPGGVLKEQRTWRHQAGRPLRWARRRASSLTFRRR
jgi:hypothetical protein